MKRVEFSETIAASDLKASRCRYTRGDPEIRGKVLLNRIAFIDCSENSQT